ncbi:MAG: hypothetical protein JXA49_10690 [Actinobacteria bacterium]|nr:hypothetical protein [Actinomycetota bacterium]
MKKGEFRKLIALAACISLVLLLFPAMGASAAEFNWTMEADQGITDPNNFHLACGEVYHGSQMVYSTNFLGLPVPANPTVLYSYDGAQFTPVGSPGFGDGNNTGLHPTAVYHDLLYVGTANGTTGAELFTWNGAGNPLKVTASTGGWGEGAGNDTIFPQGVVNDKLIVTVANRTGAVTGGIRIYEFDGTVWTQLVGPTAAVPSGFGDTNNEAAAPGVVLGGKLIFPTLNTATGLEVWEYDGTNFVQIGAPGAGSWSANQTAGTVAQNPVSGTLYLGTGDATGTEGCEIWAFDGTTWINVKAGGIDQGTNDMFVQPCVSGNDLYVATANFAAGGRVYKLVGATFMPLSQPGFGVGAANADITIETYRGKLIGTTLNAGAGGQVWTTPILSSIWFFAEGTTRNNLNDGSYDEWLCIQNPGANDADVIITYMFSDGTTQTQNVLVVKESRKTISVNDAIGAGKDVSTIVESNWPILVERPMYFSYRGKWPGGHIVMGVNQPRDNWFFAEGTTRNNQNDGSYEEWLCLQNPTAADAVVDVTYMLETGDTVIKQYDVGATSRRTIDVNLDVGANHDVSIALNSSQPIVAERPMYFNYRDKWTGGHNVVGAPGPARTFYFAEGTTRDNVTDGAFEEWICIQNPGLAEATVNITYWTANAGTQTQTVTVGATSRQTVDVKLRLGADVDTSFKVDSDEPILVERPMYFNYHNVWPGGHNVMGCPGPTSSFYFAEGTTLPEFNTYLAVLNPGTTPANVTFNYMLEGEPNKTVSVVIDPEKRYTHNVADSIGLNKNVSVMVQSDQPIVAERPMYFGYHGVWPGGHDTLGYGI